SAIMQVRLAAQHPNALLELFDSQGKLMLSQQVHEKESRINTAQLPSGTYIYRLSAATGLNESGTWVKQ
ncbi:MAG: T9SS type A sorting domain-containing protein, partial [Bacteroidales bacterium]|nr:T9SS type A sorting domain-containing protein [Bacteroidales bacterium]